MGQYRPFLQMDSNHNNSFVPFRFSLPLDYSRTYLCSNYGRKVLVMALIHWIIDPWRPATITFQHTVLSALSNVS
jgi:hypothetical protein